MTDTLATWPTVLMGTYPTPVLEVVEGRGARLFDAQGRDYIDLLSGIAVASLGYGNEELARAVGEQALRLTHASNLVASRPVVEVGAALCSRFPAPDARVFFCNSGAEANEAALKLSRRTGRRRVLAAVNGFHGRTMGALALTGQPAKRAAFEPLPGGVEFFPYGDAEYLRTLVETNPAEVAAIFLEPIQGETGVIPAPAGFLSAVRDLCDEHGILMVLDEVQTGVGRTGEFFAFEHEGVIPDVVTLAKGLGAGLPIGACLAHGEAARLLGLGDHGTTFGGNPVACAAARVVLGTVDADFLARVRQAGERLRAGLEALPQVEYVRGRGLMLGAVLRSPVAAQAVRAGRDHGLILNAPSESVLRLVPPLVITDNEIDEALLRMGAVLDGLDVPTEAKGS
ncbi:MULTISPECIES: acetylornithine transaminase [unclassified Corynebacterium]|uniref:acetylornithine transaminase n=1 Tax=unclassified Corynebacterium TaxID=2624378 RepID=UPI0029C9E8D8|nr:MULTISPECIES: acetylornithine transaminase [unclassified Corynebacterium]WPF67111.1 acetylornithine transaminase [Corynebacterium sp. 22KM0430]WPF69599.1 acetylornithine transaminase [Corynebacterium sp. 21KM1197]